MNEEPENRKKEFTPNLKGKNLDEVSTQLSSQRTGMSFQRTRLSADRTLMAVIRTSLSLIAFGFTIFQFFRYLRKYSSKFPNDSVIKLFSISMVILGLLILVLGIIYHVTFMLQIRRGREDFIHKGLLFDIDKYPVSMALIIAVLLFILGIITIITMTIQIQSGN